MNEYIKTHGKPGERKVRTHIGHPTMDTTICGLDTSGDDVVHDAPPEHLPRGKRHRVTCEDCQLIIGAVKDHLPAKVKSWERMPVRIQGENVGWLEMNPQAASKLAKATMGHKANPTASLAIRGDTMEIVDVDLRWPPGIPENPSDYQMVLDVMTGSHRLAGARFTETQAADLCERITERATLPSLTNHGSGCH